MDRRRKECQNVEGSCSAIGDTLGTIWCDVRRSASVRIEQQGPRRYRPSRCRMPHFRHGEGSRVNDAVCDCCTRATTAGTRARGDSWCRFQRTPTLACVPGCDSK